MEKGIVYFNSTKTAGKYKNFVWNLTEGILHVFGGKNNEREIRSDSHIYQELSLILNGPVPCETMVNFINLCEEDQDAVSRTDIIKEINETVKELSDAALAKLLITAQNLKPIKSSF